VIIEKAFGDAFSVYYNIMTKQAKHENTSISLHPLSFEEAIGSLTKTPKHGDSPVEASCSTKEDGPESDLKAQ